VKRIGAALLKAPIYVYRYTLSQLIGRQCRHLPTCSEYALDAIDKNGAWRGFWLGLSRVLRCHPWGTSGFDPAPDIRAEKHFWAPWRYGRWNAQQMKADHPHACDCEAQNPASQDEREKQHD
jgi:putative membrane protein insertion efficiency factor